MKVILIKDVARLGRKSEVREVPDGHALNFLIPRKMAIIATNESLKRLNEEVQKHGAQKESKENDFLSACAKLKERTITLAVNANAQGHLFKGVHAGDIARQFANEGIPLSESSIVLPQPIKEIGVHTITLKYGTHSDTCTLTIVKK